MKKPALPVIPRTRLTAPPSTTLAVILAAATAAADWPQFRGGGRYGRSTGSPPLTDTLPDGDLRVLWKKKVGEGFAGPVVAGGKVLLFHRLANRATVTAFAAGTGEREWESTYRTLYSDDFGFDEGPRSPPTVEGGSVLTFGAGGVLQCLSLHSGERRWSHDLAEDPYQSPKGFFGRACAPLITGGEVIVHAGGDRAGIVAFALETGEKTWVRDGPEASYSSPISLRMSGTETGLFFSREGFHGFEIPGGRELFSVPFRSGINASVNAAMPVLCGTGASGAPRVFLSSCYGVGAALWELSEQGKPQEIWKEEDRLDCHYASPVFHEGFLYGFHGRQERGQELRCIAADTGEVRWSSRAPGTGQLIIADGKLILVNENGELVVAEATSGGYSELLRSQILPRPARAAPAFSGGFLYAKGDKLLVCIDLRKPAP